MAVKIKLRKNELASVRPLKENILVVPLFSSFHHSISSLFTSFFLQCKKKKESTFTCKTVHWVMIQILILSAPSGNVRVQVVSGRTATDLSAVHRIQHSHVSYKQLLVYFLLSDKCTLSMKLWETTPDSPALWAFNTLSVHASSAPLGNGPQSLFSFFLTKPIACWTSTFVCLSIINGG